MGQLVGKIRLDEVDLNKAILKVEGFLVSSKPCLIFTPNPEMVVKANSDEMFLRALNKSDLNLCDGFGLWLAAKKRMSHIRRITGVDFMQEICRLAEIHNKKVYLLGGRNSETPRKTKEYLLRKFPKLIVCGFERGIEMSEEKNGSLTYDENENNLMISRINELAPAVIFVAFGMGKQEKWIVNNVEKIPTAKVAMGVGGAFDYLSGEVKRAPLLMRKIGLEWAYRLVKEPSRFVRIYNATLRFVVLLITRKI